MSRALALAGFRGGVPAGLGELGFDWSQIIAPISNFGQTFLVQWGNRGAYQNGINPNVPAQNYVTQPPAAIVGGVTTLPQTTGVGFGLDSQGVRLSDGSHIGWLPIAGVALAWKLLQAQPYRRAGR